MPELTATFRCIVLVAAATFATTVPGQVYKWVDEKGVTHYSSTPPPDRSASKLGSIPPVAPQSSDAANERARKEADELRRASSERRRLEELEETRRAADQRVADVRAQLCGRSTQQLVVLTTGGPVYRFNERGERVFLDDSLRDAEIARARLEVERNCGKVDVPRATEEARRFDAQQKATARCDLLRRRLAEVQRLEFRASDAEIQQARDAVAQACGPQR